MIKVKNQNEKQEFKTDILAAGIGDRDRIALHSFQFSYILMMMMIIIMMIMMVTMIMTTMVLMKMLMTSDIGYFLTHKDFQNIYTHTVHGSIWWVLYQRAQYQWCATQFDNIAFGTTSQAGHFITTAPRCETFHRHFIISGIQQIII